MPSGGLMQLVSYGSENLYLTGNPQITFFKTAYRRHTNFALNGFQNILKIHLIIIQLELQLLK